MLVRVQDWPHEAEALGLDVWTHRAVARSVVARVTPTQRPVLDASGYAYAVLDPDLGARLQAERAQRLAAPPVLGGGLDPAFYDSYQELPAVLARLDALVAARPERVSLVEVGSSIEGRPIRGVRITDAAPHVPPVVLVQGGQHAREWIAVAATLHAAESLATAAEGSAVDELLDHLAVVVVPVVNPDGYAYSWSTDRLWRKNRRDGHGVDLNRNWSVAWGGEGGSASPDHGSYRGAAPFSEPETAAMRDLVAATPDVLALLDVHSFGQLLLYPWGHATNDVPGEHALFEDLALDMADAMEEPHGQAYEPLQGAELYPAAGNAVDWGYGVHGLYAVGLELRPRQDGEAGFELPDAQIVPTGEELLAAILVLTETSLALGPGTPGDDGDAPPPSADDTTTGDVDEGSGGDGDPALTSDPWPFDTTGEIGETGGGADGDEAEGQGCGCRAAHGAESSAWWAWAALGLVASGRRRRRACS